jgi:hypothetical protein
MRCANVRPDIVTSSRSSSPAIGDIGLGDVVDGLGLVGIVRPGLISIGTESPITPSVQIDMSELDDASVGLEAGGLEIDDANMFISPAPRLPSCCNGILFRP